MSNEINKIYQRSITKNIKKWLKRPEILVIIGSRQVGKTFYVNNLLPQITDKEIKYFSFEDFETRELYNSDKKAFLQTIKDQDKLYVFDEFQKAPDFSSLLKSKYDLGKNRFPKIILTGSSSLRIQKEVSESLAGQSITFKMHPLSFLEKYGAERIDFIENIADLDINNIKSRVFHFQKELERSFSDYLKYGGYPELGELENEMKWEKLKNIYETILEKDLQSLVKNEHLFSSKKLLEILAHRVGNIISFENLSSDLQLNIKTTRRLASILEGLFFVNFIFPKANFGNEYKKAPKVYFFDPGLRNELIKVRRPPTDNTLVGPLVENFIFCQLQKYLSYEKDFKFSYWQDYNGNEVDFILEHSNELISIEVKYRRSQKTRLSAGVRNFIKKYQPAYHLMATYDHFGEEKFANTKVYYLPAWTFGLIV